MSFEPSYWIRVGNTADPLLYTPQDAAGATVDLSAATAITFRMRKPGVAARKVDAAGTLVNPGATNQLKYEWTGPDVDEAGIFGFYFEVEMPGEKPRSFPNDHDDYLQVTPS